MVAGLWSVGVPISILLPSLFTSAWLWLYAGVGFLLKAARRFDIGFDWFNRRFDKPSTRRPLQLPLEHREQTHDPGFTPTVHEQAAATAPLSSRAVPCGRSSTVSLPPYTSRPLQLTVAAGSTVAGGRFTPTVHEQAAATPMLRRQATVASGFTPTVHEQAAATCSAAGANRRRKSFTPTVHEQAAATVRQTPTKQVSFSGRPVFRMSKIVGLHQKPANPRTLGTVGEARPTGSDQQVIVPSVG
jgi:hypothetical protein